MFANTAFKEQTRLEDFTAWLNRNALHYATDQHGNIVGLTNTLTFEPEAIVDRTRALADLANFAVWWETYAPWVVGDAWAMGFREVGELFAQNKSTKTIENWKRVAESYAHHERVAGLSFTHHNEVYAMPDKRRRAALLEIAATTPNFTAAQLRALKNADSGGNDAPLFVTGMKRFDLAQGLEMGLINREELSAFIKKGYLNLRVEYTITGE